MRRYKKILLLLLITLNAFQSQARLIPPFKSFNKELSFQDKRIILSSSPDIVTENDSFIYAICDVQEKTFKENRCNVSVETPGFANASYVDTCIVSIAPAKPKLESLTKLSLYPFTDDKVLLSWLVKDLDWRTKFAVVRSLYMSSCKFQDVSVPADKILDLVPYDNTFDLVLSGSSLCPNSDGCKLTYNAEGKKVNGPTSFLPGMSLKRVMNVLPATPRSPIKGFYALALLGNDTSQPRVLQVGSDGKGTELLRTGAGAADVKLSNTLDLLSVCWKSESTNVTCWQYDAKMSVKFKVSFEFLDDWSFGVNRWLRPHNLQEGGLLLLTGASSGKDNRSFESFSVIRVQPNGQRDRPLLVQGLGFECSSAADFRINVSENDDDEFCLHFACERGNFGSDGIKNVLKFSTKCLPKRHASPVKRRASVLN